MSALPPFLVSGFVTLGVGRIPFAPGTWGSLVGALIWWALNPSLFWGSLWIVLVFLVSIPLVNLYEQQQASHDPKEVIIDEVVGIWITLLGLPLEPMVVLIGFILFRFFDILKPFPISWMDREMKGAFGTLCDDVAAGLLARGILGYLVSLELQWMVP